MVHFSDAISPTDFILGTKVQPIKAHSMTQLLMNLTEDQGRLKSWVKVKMFLKKGYKTKHLAISWMLFHPQTSSHLLSQLFVTHSCFLLK